jgi:hypothetical protein
VCQRHQVTVICRYAKVQGASMDKIVIDLTPYDVPPFATFEQMIVALSRVRTGDGVRYIGGKSVAHCGSAFFLTSCLTPIQLRMTLPGCHSSRYTR